MYFICIFLCWYRVSLRYSNASTAIIFYIFILSSLLLLTLNVDCITPHIFLNLFTFFFNTRVTTKTYVLLIDSLHYARTCSTYLSLFSRSFNVKHWKWYTWHRKASAKNSSKLNKFLHSEVNQLIQHIIVQDQDGQNNNTKTYIASFAKINLQLPAPKG